MIEQSALLGHRGVQLGWHPNEWIHNAFIKIWKIMNNYGPLFYENCQETSILDWLNFSGGGQLIYLIFFFEQHRVLMCQISIGDKAGRIL